MMTLTYWEWYLIVRWFWIASLGLGILRKPSRVFNNRSLLERCFCVFILPVLEYCSSPWCSAADTLIPSATISCSKWYKIFNLWCALLWMLRMIMCNPMQALWGAVPVLFVPLLVTHRDLIAYRHPYAPPCWRTPQHGKTFIPLSASLWNDLTLVTLHVFDGVGLAGIKSMANALLL